VVGGDCGRSWCTQRGWSGSHQGGLRAGIRSTEYRLFILDPSNYRDSLLQTAAIRKIYPEDSTTRGELNMHHALRKYSAEELGTSRSGLGPRFKERQDSEERKRPEEFTKEGGFVRSRSEVHYSRRER
jgi:hypothetical protein